MGARPGLYDETRMGQLAKGRQGAPYTAGPGASYCKEPVLHTRRTRAQLTMDSASVVWLDCLWVSRTASSAFQPGSGEVAPSGSIPPFSWTALPSVRFTHGHQSLCWEVGSKKLREDVSCGRRHSEGRAAGKPLLSVKAHASGSSALP